MPEAVRALAVAGVIITGTIGWMSWRALKLAPDDPDRLVAELRLAQLAALALVAVGAGYAGVAVAHPEVPGTALDVTFAFGFLVLAATATLSEPRQALAILAAAALAHAVLDVLHRPGLLPAGIAPRWFMIGCATQNLVMGALCFLPVAQRSQK
jgi:hypothetical protein